MIVDHQLAFDTSIVCITADGYGYGIDGSGWGGEILLGNCIDFDNRAGLRSYVYPGGDLSAIFGVRPLIGILKDSLDKDAILAVAKGRMASESSVLDESMFSILFDVIDRGVNTISTSSAGRYLDAVATILGVCDSNTYDGECPMKLEAIARRGDLHIEPMFLKQGKRRVVDLAYSMQTIMQKLAEGVPVPDLAYAAQQYLGESLATLAVDIAESEGVKHIGFSGGVGLNRIITEAVVSNVKAAGLNPLIHERVPPGDGGVSIGQVMVAAALLQENR